MKFRGTSTSLFPNMILTKNSSQYVCGEMVDRFFDNIHGVDNIQTTTYSVVSSTNSSCSMGFIYSHLYLTASQPTTSIVSVITIFGFYLLCIIVK